jgi:transposase InsO family protein
MPWKECSAVSQREELVALVRGGAMTAMQASRRYGVSRKTVYKWLGRAASEDALAMQDRSRRPRRSPAQTPPELEREVLRVREEHPAWGGRKIRRVLRNQGLEDVPAASTVRAILHRHGKIDAEEGRKHEPFTRFEHEQPNDLWQMDFKGHVPMRTGGRCHPLTTLDDHSRFCIGLRACADEQGGTVKEELTRMFRTYGMPRRMLMDNGSPWGSSDPESRFTPLTVYLLRLGVGVTHGRPYHPQTQGKDERFHRTLKLELLSRQELIDRAGSQTAFDGWRDGYNLRRPHEALGMEVPADRYRPSERVFPEKLGPIEYPAGDVVRIVGMHGRISYKNQRWRVPRAFRGEPVALREGMSDGVIEVYYGTHPIGVLDLRIGPDSPEPLMLSDSARYARSVGQHQRGQTP